MCQSYHHSLASSNGKLEGWKPRVYVAHRPSFGWGERAFCFFLVTCLGGKVVGIKVGRLVVSQCQVGLQYIDEWYG